MSPADPGAPGAEEPGPEPQPKRKRRRRSPLMALAASSACALGLWILAPDLLYAAEGAPLQLDGTQAPLSPEQLGGNRFVHLVAPGEATGWFAELAGDRRELVLVPGARLVVLAPPRADAEPSLVLVDAEGRLLRGDRAGGWSAAAAAAAQRRGGTEASYFVLVQGERPEVPWGKGALALLLTVILGLNLASLAPRSR